MDLDDIKRMGSEATQRLVEIYQPHITKAGQRGDLQRVAELHRQFEMEREAILAPLIKAAHTIPPKPIIF